jgi:hypothetical protein
VTRGAEVCGGCRFWEKRDEGSEMGECRRRPPRGYPMPMAPTVSPALAIAGRPAFQVQAIAIFPPTHASAWCGEYEEDDAGEGEA